MENQGDGHWRIKGFKCPPIRWTYWKPQGVWDDHKQRWRDHKCHEREAKSTTLKTKQDKEPASNEDEVEIKSDEEEELSMILNFKEFFNIIDVEDRR